MDRMHHRRNSPHFLVLLLFLSSSCLRSRAEVISLTDETFADKNLGTLWEDLGKAMEGEDEIEIGQVDCSMNKPVCTKVDIHSYPTFKIFYDGEEIAKYKGPREVESLRQFVLDEAEKAARVKLEAE